LPAPQRVLEKGARSGESAKEYIGRKKFLSSPFIAET